MELVGDAHDLQLPAEPGRLLFESWAQKGVQDGVAGHNDNTVMHQPADVMLVSHWQLWPC
jgi:hypothetical protein